MQETLQSLGPIFLAALVVLQIIVTVSLVFALRELRGLRRQLSLFERKTADLSRSIVAELQGPLVQISSALAHLERHSAENAEVLIAVARETATQISARLLEISSKDRDR